MMLSCVGVVVLLSGCLNNLTGGESKIVCNKPYIRVGSSCCLDQNGNGICDKDESSSPQGESSQTTLAPSTGGTPTTTIVSAGGAPTTVPSGTPTTVPSGVTPTTIPSGATQTTLPDEEPPTTVPESAPTTTLGSGEPTTTTTVSEVTTTTAGLGGMGGIACSSIFHPLKQASCDGGICPFGYKCNYHSTPFKSCTCDLVFSKHTTTTTLPLLLVSCGSSYPSCGGYCLAGQVCTSTYMTGPGGVHIPIGCSCKAGATTTTIKVLGPLVTIPAGGLILNCAASYPGCGGSCPSGQECAITYSVHWIGGDPVMTPSGCGCKTVATTTTTTVKVLNPGLSGIQKDLITATTLRIPHYPYY